MAEVGWWRWYLGGGAGEVGRKITAASFSFAKQVPSRSWFSDASTRALGGVCMETRVFWRYELPEEVQGRTIRARQKGEGDFICINELELMAMVMTTYVMVISRGDRPEREGEAVIMRADNQNAVSWVKKCGGAGKKKARIGALMRVIGSLGDDWGLVFSGEACTGCGE
ncbi:unnamed protein product [Ectocarpus sp. CCAP 1310/34]|nr:unnamed protein product [Ectocarpus sp. CCAP 1310/34]